MHRIDADGNISNLFVPGDPSIGQQATVVDAPWLNDVQEELCNTVSAAGITLVKGTQTQLRDAVRALALVALRTAANTWSGLQSFAAGATVAGGLTTDTVHVTGTATFDTAPALVTPSFASNYSAGGTAPIRAWKALDGKTVTIQGHINHSTAQANGATYTAGTLPAGYLPGPGGAFGFCLGGSAGVVGYCNVDSSGNINVALPGAGTESVYYINVTFRTDAP